MTSLTDRLAALPKMPTDDDGARFPVVSRIERVLALEARNAMLCEALREYGDLTRLLLQHSTYSGGMVTYAELPNVRGHDSLSSAIARHRDNARAILAACEQEQRK